MWRWDRLEKRSGANLCVGIKGNEIPHRASSRMDSFCRRCGTRNWMRSYVESDQQVSSVIPEHADMIRATWTDERMLVRYNLLTFLLKKVDGRESNVRRNKLNVISRVKDRTTVS